MRIPPPENWDEFEKISLSSLKIKWGSPNLQRNGRQGQSQAGVDIFGEDDLGRFVGVQCKNNKSEIKIATVIEEITKAEQFDPPLSCFYIATTLPNDAPLQREIRLLSVDRVKKNSFPVGIFFWEDIYQELIKNPQEFSVHYPQINLNIQNPRISVPQLLCNLDIAYLGVQIQNYTRLIFGEIGFMAGEDPIQIRGVGSTIKSCASVLLKSEKANEINNKIDGLISLALKECESEEENESRWGEVDKLCTLILQDISDLEYKHTGVFLAIFRLGVFLGKWNIIAESDRSLPEEDLETLLSSFSALEAKDDLKEKVRDLFNKYNTSDETSNLYIPHKVYVLARGLILHREIFA